MIYFEKSSSNKTAFITGAASGLGRAFTLLLAEQKWTLGICDINQEGLSETKTLAEQNGGKVFTYSLDVSDPKAYENTSKEFLGNAGSIDLLINNAGIGASGKTEELSAEYWNRVIGINQMAAIYGCINFIPQMKSQGNGNIINIASAAAFASAAAMGPYNTGKAAVLSLSETLYAELKGSGINISVVMPTFFKSNIMKDVAMDNEGKRMGELMVATSGIDANAMASKILRKASNGHFYIILPWKSKFLYFLKRLMPNIVLRGNALFYKKRNEVEKHLEKKYQKIKDKN